MNSRPSVSPYRPSVKWLMVPRKPDYPYPSGSYLANSSVSQAVYHFLRDDVTDPPSLQTKFSPLSLVQQMVSLIFCTPHHTDDFSFSLSSTCSVICRGPEMATHSSILAWRIPGMGEPGGLPSVGSHRAGHDWSALAVAVAANNFIYFTATVLVPTTVCIILDTKKQGTKK